MFLRPFYYSCVALALTAFQVEAKAIFLADGEYELVKAQSPACPDGFVREFTTKGKTLLMFGSKVSMQLRPESGREQADGGCLYVTNAAIKGDTLTYTTLRSNCKEAGSVVQTIKKTGPNLLEYNFSDKSSQQTFTCWLKKLPTEAQ